jgi:hypothetical protein
MVEDRLRVPWFPVGGEPHHLVLARVDLEAGVVGERGVEQADAVGKVDLALQVQGVAAADGDRGGGPFSHPIHGQHDGFMEWRGEEGGGRVALVVLGKQELCTDLAARRELRQRLLQVLLLEQLLLDPQWDRPAEGGKAARRVGKVGLEQPLELDQRLLEEHDVVDLIEVDLARRKAVADRLGRKAGVMALACEAFLLGGRNHAAVLDEGRRAVVIKGREAEQAHGRPRAQPLRRWCR